MGNEPLPLVQFFLRNKQLLDLIQRNGEIASFVSSVANYCVNQKVKDFGDVSINNEGIVSIPLK